MYIWFKHLCLAKTNTKKIKATATFYDLCVLRNVESSEQYLSAKCAIIGVPTVWFKSYHVFNVFPLSINFLCLVLL